MNFGLIGVFLYAPVVCEKAKLISLSRSPAQVVKAGNPTPDQLQQFHKAAAHFKHDAAKDAGYDVTLRYVAVASADLNLDRIEARVAKGGHWIEPETVRRRAVSSLENLPTAVSIADRAFLLDNSGNEHRQVLKIGHRGELIQESTRTIWKLLERRLDI